LSQQRKLEYDNFEHFVYCDYIRVGCYTMTPKLSNDILDFLNHDSTKDFLVAANNFVDIVETKNITKDEFIKRSHRAIIDLYSTGDKLREIELKYSSADSDFDRDKIFENKNAGLISELGEKAFYWEVFDPTYFEQNGEPKLGWTITDKEASQGWLVDDFAEIYRDLKIELEKIKKIGTDEAVEDALWQLKFSFRNHWGGHAINAIRYLHFFWYDNKA
jgi:hypothetical protein